MNNGQIQRVYIGLKFSKEINEGLCNFTYSKLNYSDIKPHGPHRPVADLFLCDYDEPIDTGFFKVMCEGYQKLAKKYGNTCSLEFDRHEFIVHSVTPPVEEEDQVRNLKGEILAPVYLRCVMPDWASRMRHLLSEFTAGRVAPDPMAVGDLHHSDYNAEILIGYTEANAMLKPSYWRFDRPLDPIAIEMGTINSKGGMNTIATYPV